MRTAFLVLLLVGCGAGLPTGRMGLGGRGGNGAGGTRWFGGAGGAGGGCGPDLYVDWQIQSPSAVPVTCDAAGAAAVVVSIDGYDYPQVCPPGYSSGAQDILLQSTFATYDVTVTLESAAGAVLAVPQMTTINVTSCGVYQTPGPAVLIVSPPSP